MDVCVGLCMYNIIMYVYVCVHVCVCMSMYYNMSMSMYVTQLRARSRQPFDWIYCVNRGFYGFVHNERILPSGYFLCTGNLL